MFFSSAAGSDLFAADSTRTSYTHHKNAFQTIGSDIGITFSDWGKFLTYPLHMSGSDWMIGGAAITSGILLSIADKKVTDQISIGGSSDYHGDFWDIPTAYGYVIYGGVASLGVYLTGLFIKNEFVRVTGRMLIESGIYSGSLSYLCKFVIGRERPYISDNQYRFNAFQSNPDYQSLPSGHTTFAFAISTVMAERLDTWWSRVFFYSLAGMTAYARIRNNMHWLSDTFYGALLGFGSGWFVVHNENNRNKSPEKKGKSGGKFSFGPSMNGINLSYSF
jgi:membrane-associated phospholipid phosphatase